MGMLLSAHVDNESRIARVKEDGGSIMESQFIMELQGLRAVDGEDPPKILHFNPRLKGDWSGYPVIEHNTCYSMQWGSAKRCDGRKSRADEETVDGQVKCEKWIRDDDSDAEELKVTRWLKRLIGRTKQAIVDWPFPFAEKQLFVLTLSAGLEGYHINVDGRHISSFPYRPLCLLHIQVLLRRGISSYLSSGKPHLFPTDQWKSLLAYSLLDIILLSEWQSENPGCSMNQSSLQMLSLDVL